MGVLVDATATARFRLATTWSPDHAQCRDREAQKSDRVLIAQVMFHKLGIFKRISAFDMAIEL